MSDPPFVLVAFRGHRKVSEENRLGLRAVYCPNLRVLRLVESIWSAIDFQIFGHVGMVYRFSSLLCILDNIRYLSDIFRL